MGVFNKQTIDMVNKKENSYIKAQNLISQLENNIIELKSALSAPKKVSISKLKKDLHKIKSLAVDLGIKLTKDQILWLYDGYNFVGQDGRNYSVPLNYASKSKLVPWDILKLMIMEDGELIYKLITPASRKKMRAILSKDTNGRWVANTKDHNIYILNLAAISFFKWRVGDQITITVNPDLDIQFAAVDNIIKSDIKDALYKSQ